MNIITQRNRAEPAHFMVPANEWFYGNHVFHEIDQEAHDHNCLELAFVLSGRARHVTIDGWEECRGGDLLIIPLGAWHSYADARGLELVNCLLSPSMLQNELAWLAGDEGLGTVLGLSAAGSLMQPSRWRMSRVRMERIRPLLFELLGCWQHSASRVELLGHLLLLLAQVSKVVASVATTPVSSGQMHASVARAIRLLHENIAHEWTLGALAGHLRLNPSYLVRLFRIHTQLPPMKYLDRLRANRAATLLFSSGLTIGEIGEQVGWADPKLFARQFRQHFGQSATRYRARLLGGALRNAADQQYKGA